MIKLLRVVFLVTLSVSQFSCASFMYSYPGEKLELSTEITFLSPDGTQLPNERVYVVETVGNVPVVMHQLRTSFKGSVVLSGRYCGPIEVAVDGGSVVIHAEDWEAEYVVTTSPAHLSLERAFGVPDPNAERYRESPDYCWNRGSKTA